MKWFHYDQNNSGGYFIVNDVVAEDVYIQAPSAAEAEERAEEIFEPYSQFCDCCGRRWTFGYMSDADGYDVPTNYDVPITEVIATKYRKQARLHHADGSVESFNYKTTGEHHANTINY
jgi:biotin carboxylase